MLAEMASIAREHEVDAVLVCGDVFDTAAPTPESERIAYRALLDLAATGTRVVVIAGNHDSDRRWQAVQPLLELGAIVTRPVFADPETSVVEVPSKDGREVMLVAALPFLSQRWVVKAAQLMGGEAAESAQLYEERYRKLTEWLCARFRPDTVNVVAAHAFVHGSDPSGSERAAHLSSCVRRSGDGLSRDGALRGPRSSPSSPADRRAVPDPVLRIAAATRLRRGRPAQGRGGGRGRPGRARPGHRGAAHGRPFAGDRRGHAWPSCASAPSITVPTCGFT